MDISDVVKSLLLKENDLNLQLISESLRIIRSEYDITGTAIFLNLHYSPTFDLHQIVLVGLNIIIYFIIKKICTLIKL